MKQSWKDLADRFANLAKRERAILFAGGLAAILLLGLSLMDTSLAKQRQLNKQLTQVSTEKTLAQTQVAELKRQLALNPEVVAREKIQNLIAEIAQIDAQVKDVHKGLVSPERMAGVLEDMLTRNRRVQLIALKTLPIRTLTGGEPAADDRSGVYRHGVELSLEGGYLDLLDYVARLERLPWQMFWASADMDASRYPKVRFTVVVYTLSLDKKWMVI